MYISKKSVLLVSILLILLFSGCSNTRVIDSRIDDALSNSTRSQDAINWLTVNEDMVLPVLINRLSSDNENKVNETITLLKTMGDYGNKIMVKNFVYLNDSGKHSVIEMISSNNDKDSIIQLLALSTVEGGFDKCVQELIIMKDSSKDYIMSMLYMDAYYDTINAVVAGYGTSVVEDVIPLIHSSNDKIENRALEILSLAGEIVTEPLIDEVLNNSITEQQAKKIAEITLINTKDKSRNYIINKISSGDGDAKIAGIMLYEINKDSDTESVLKKCAMNKNSVNIVEMLKEYAILSGVEDIVEIALNTDDYEIKSAAALALSDTKFAQETFVVVIKDIVESDDETSKKYELADSLIYDETLSTLAKSIISQNVDEMAKALSSGYDPKIIGKALTQTSDNIEVVNRIDVMLDNMDDLNAKNAMMVLCFGEDLTFPSLVWKRYANGNSQLSEYAMDVILEATPSGIKYQYTKMDFMPYAEKLVRDLKSENQFTRAAASQMFEKVPEGVEHHEFYQYIFDNKPNQKAFQVLCWHYAGENALPIELKVKGINDVINTVSYEIADADVSDLDSKYYPDYNTIVKSALSYMGLNVVESADVKLSFDIDQKPRYETYRGLVGKSYLGAESECVISVYKALKKQDVFKGEFTIEPPDEKPVGDDISEYMESPQDAPIEEVFVTSYIEALYKTFGIEALYGTYQYDRSATLEVAASIWN